MAKVRHNLAQTDRDMTEEEVDELVRNLCVRLGQTVNIRVEQMDDIPRSANQKFRRVVSEVSLKWDGAASTEALRAAGPGAPAGDGSVVVRAEGEDA